MPISRWIRPLATVTAFLVSSFSWAAVPLSYTILEIPVANGFVPGNTELYRSWTRVFNTAQEWTDFYDVHFADLFPANSEYSTAPVIDFAQYTLIMGGLGGVTAIELLIDKLMEQDASVQVVYLTLHPESGCNVAQGITFPTKAILIPKTNKAIGFSRRDATYRCAP
jgi:hypothetical protein